MGPSAFLVLPDSDPAPTVGRGKGAATLPTHLSSRRTLYVTPVPACHVGVISRMVNSVPDAKSIDFRPVTPANLEDLERFSRAHGKFRYCSCMRWRMTSTEFSRSDKTKRTEALRGEVAGGLPTGVLAYADEAPVGWCSIAPREGFRGLERYRKLARIDDAAVWSVTCFFIDRHYRRKGLTADLLKAAIRYAGDNGARIVEGYPVDPGSTSYTYMGSPGTFTREGFTDVTPPGRERKMFRIVLDDVPES